MKNMVDCDNIISDDEMSEDKWFTDARRNSRRKPGYVNYYYKEGKLPAHTKTSFTEYEIVTVHGIITSNALLFMHKVRNFPQLLPSSIRKTIPENAPTFNSDDDSNIGWFNKYGSYKYKSTIFCKWPDPYLQYANLTTS